MSKSIHMFLEHGQAWGHGRFSEDLVAVLDHPLGKNFFLMSNPNFSRGNFKSFPLILSLESRDQHCLF